MSHVQVEARRQLVDVRVLFFHTVGLGCRTQVVRRGSKYPLSSCLTGLLFLLFLLLYYRFIFMWCFAFMYVCMRDPDSLELELQAAVSCNADAGN